MPFPIWIMTQLMHSPTILTWAQALSVLVYFPLTVHKRRLRLRPYPILCITFNNTATTYVKIMGLNIFCSSHSSPGINSRPAFIQARLYSKIQVLYTLSLQYMCTYINGCCTVSHMLFFLGRHCCFTTNIPFFCKSSKACCLCYLRLVLALRATETPCVMTKLGFSQDLPSIIQLLS